MTDFRICYTDPSLNDQYICCILIRTLLVYLFYSLLM